MASIEKNSYIKLWRSVFECEIFQGESFDKFHAWVWLISHANYKDEKRLFKGQLITIKRGQLVTSMEALAKEWGWSRNKVLRYTEMLKNDGMIAKNGTPYGTTITIEKYELYQGQRTTNGTPDGTADGTPDGTHLKNIKKYKEPQERAHAREGGAAAEWRRRKEANGDD